MRGRIHDTRCMMHDSGSGRKTGDERQETEGRMKHLSLSMHLESWIMNLAFPIFVFIRG